MTIRCMHSDKGRDQNRGPVTTTASSQERLVTAHLNGIEILPLALLFFCAAFQRHFWWTKEVRA